jgi:hypothetical protein
MPHASNQGHYLWSMQNFNQIEPSKQNMFLYSGDCWWFSNSYLKPESLSFCKKILLFQIKGV